MSSQNNVAIAFKALHKPGDPLVLTNIWDAITAKTIASLPTTKALATASFAIAAAAGIPDEELTLEINLRAVLGISKIAAQFNLPLTVDMQDGFGDELEEGVRQIIRMGAVGMNLEDFDRQRDGLFGIDEAQDRIRRAMSVARDEGVPDFFVNARTDSFFAGGDAGLDTAIQRGKAYLEAGASNVFIWGGPSRKGWGKEDVEKATEALQGRLNVILAMMQPGGLSVKQLGELGVCRISLGPQLMRKMMETLGQDASAVLEG
jgi:2-methylisocitrate lyase-like PEP mutase family enzyme